MIAQNGKYISLVSGSRELPRAGHSVHAAGIYMLAHVGVANRETGTVRQTEREKERN